MNNKLLLGGLAGAVVSFLLGMVIYMMILGDYLDANMMTGISRGEDSIMWSMILGNLGFGLMYSLVIGKWAGSRTLMSGMQNGLMLGIFTHIGTAFMTYGWSNMYNDNINVVLVELAIGVVMSTIIGAVVAWVWGMGKAAE